MSMTHTVHLIGNAHIDILVRQAIEIIGIADAIYDLNNSEIALGQAWSAKK